MAIELSHKNGWGSSPKRLWLSVSFTVPARESVDIQRYCWQSLPKEAINCPSGHQTLSKVRRFPDAKGRNSRNSAPSTGRFPPTPNPRAANMPQVPIQLGAPPTAIPKTPQIKRLKLKAGLRPMTSEATPQKEAPKQRPTKSAQVVYLTVCWSTPNSGVNDGRVRATPCLCQRAELGQFFKIFRLT